MGGQHRSERSLKGGDVRALVSDEGEREASFQRDVLGEDVACLRVILVQQEEGDQGDKEGNIEDLLVMRHEPIENLFPNHPLGYSQAIFKGF